MRILVADSQPKVRYALRVLLERKAGFKIVGEFDDIQELITQAEEKRPHVILLHWRLQGLPAPDILSVLRKTCPGAYVIALSGRPETREAALAAGVDAFVSKMDPPERLLATIDNCLNGIHSDSDNSSSPSSAF